VCGIATPRKLSVDCGLGAGGRSSACETPADVCAPEPVGASNAKRASKKMESAYCFGFIARAFQTLEIEISFAIVIRTVARVDFVHRELMAVET
jgi:hypothetical protein